MTAFVPTCCPRSFRSKRRSGRGDAVVRCRGEIPPRTYDLVTLGNAVVDVVVPLSSFPVRSGEHQNLRREVSMSPGGACNALIVASRLGLMTTAIDWIGGDSLGHFLSDRLKGLGIGTDTLLKRNAATLTCVILVSEAGEHTFVASNEQPTAELDLSANPHDAVAKLPLPFQNAVENAAVLLIDGYALDDLPFATLLGALQVAKGSGCEIWFDPQATAGHLQKTNPDLIQFLLQSITGLVLTEEELPALLSTLEISPLSLLNRYSNLQYCVVKSGARGCLVATRSNPEIITMPAIDIAGEFVDSTGAGDSFIAGFLTGVRRGLNVEQSAMLGNAAGAATCTRSGAGENVADLRKIISVLESGANKVNRSAEACRDLLNAPSLGLRNRCRDERGEEEQ